MLWVQGCPIHCTGCFNRDLWAFEDRTRVDTASAAEKIFGVRDIDGVTFSGGEPFAQARALAELGGILREREKSVVTYTGFSYADLRKKDRPSWNNLLAVTDLLIAGPYKEGNEVPVCGGASHKEMIPLSEKGRMLCSTAIPPGETMEFVVQRDGTVIATGFPDGEIRRTLHAMIPL